MRKTATFPAGEIGVFKKQLVTWAGNFFSAVCLDTNDYTEFHSPRRLLAAAGEIEILQQNHNFFESLNSLHKECGDWLFGFLSYDLKNEIEPGIFANDNKQSNGAGFPLGYFFRPKHIIEVIDQTIYVYSDEDPEKIYESILATRVIPFANSNQKSVLSALSKKEYINKIEQIKEHIGNGDLYELNFCQEFFMHDADVNPMALFNKLNEASPAPFASFVKFGTSYVMCASPERFLKKEGSMIISQPMKGTLKRLSGEEDLLQKIKLKNDPKERAENVMIVDLMRNDLSKSAVAGTVNVDALCEVYTFPHLHQMVSTISARANPEIPFAHIIRNAFPMGSMTGAPKVMAMKLIDEYETSARGLFSGSIGFITPNGDFDFNVVIRSIFYNGAARYLNFLAGSAITWDCIAEYEYEECLLKAKSIFKILNA